MIDEYPLQKLKSLSSLSMTTFFSISRYFILLLILAPYANSISFNFDFSDPNFNQFDNIILEGDAVWNRTVIYLTNDFLNGNPTNSVGRASYKQPLSLWSNTSSELTNFTTSFTFFIKTLESSFFPRMPNGDGITFFLAPFQSRIPEKNVTGGCLALISLCETHSAPIVAVEFDTHKNKFDPSGDHVGIDVTNMTSIAYNNTSSMKNGDTTLSATVNYNGATGFLSVSLSFDNNPSNVTLVGAFVDMKSVFNDSQVAFGFSSATGNDVEIHQILRWSFNSSFESSPNWNKTNSDSGGFSKKLVVGLSIGLGFLVIVLLGLACCFYRLYVSKTIQEVELVKQEDEIPMLDNRLVSGPRRISYHELCVGTSEFDQKYKLGEGGFGSVYRGSLADGLVAIKKLSERSDQGEKEFISEVTTISKLAHKNLVQMIGWCHEGEDYLLVYELMPNGSLDGHLFNTEKPLLCWPKRYNIAIDLADAILYLHEKVKYKTPVIHRDIKASNVMLDADFNAKLGDFGLARFADNSGHVKTTFRAGTPPYLAPECYQQERIKPTVKSDVYSYGFLLIEIASGKPANFTSEYAKKGLVEWVWDLYGKHCILDAVDPRLNDTFNVQEMKRVMIVGLWCAHPDKKERPSMREAIKALMGESQLPTLPPEKPWPAYYGSIATNN